MTCEDVLTKHGLERYAECGDGWAGILDRLITDLIAMGWDKDVHQIKEKCGGLRFYIGASGEALEGRIDAAERESCVTCEVCGKPGKERPGGWIKTLCNEHARKK